MPLRKQLCTFALGGLQFAVPVAQVREVFANPVVTPVPLAPDAVKGLINLRGQLVPVIDLRKCLELEHHSENELSIKLIAIIPEGLIAFSVDAIGDVIEVEDEMLEDRPETLRGPFSEVVRGIYKLPRQLLLEVDVTQIAVFEGPSITRVAETTESK